MQALILAGGEGTRLRPLTTTVPKPVLPLAGRPFLAFMISWLRRHGVDDIVLSCGFLGDAVRAVLGERHGGARLRYVREERPLGTAGPVRLALDRGALDERFVVCNGDILTDADLGALVARHEQVGAAATLALVAVEDMSGYGVVPTAPSGEVEAFLEKTEAPVSTNHVNGGIYVVERAVAEEIPSGRAVSFEREVFPALVGRGLFGRPAEGYWIDIGTPERYLEATYDLLAGVVESDLPPRDVSGSLVAESCITSGARIGPQSVVGAHCSVGAGATVARSVLHERVTVGEEAQLLEAVVAAGARLGKGARLERGAVVGAGAEISAGTVVGAGQRVEPAGAAEMPA
ncbi:MAG: sugar phosphate nucleotidyltransferase [Thermoleophilaceae bacterium]